ncbi:RNA-binding domain-containing protein [Methanopyrus kandleri]
MTLPVNSISARVIAHATEDEKKVLEALANVLGGVLGEEDVEPETFYAEGHHGNPITIFQVKIDRSKYIERVLEHWRENIPEEERRRVWSDIERRVDDKGNLYLRFDKQSAYKGELRISDADDVIRVKVNLESYPASREGGIKTLERLGIFSDD